MKYGVGLESRSSAETHGLHYEDFIVEIGPDWQSESIVRVLKSPAGTGESSFTLPWTPEDLGPLLTELGRAVHASTNRHLTPVTITSDTSPRRVGGQLFNALFSGQVRNLLDQSLGALEAAPESGLRITLKLNPHHPQLARIFSLPWELLYRAETEDFLTFSRVTPLVRALDAPRAPRPATFPSTLNVLVVSACPQELPLLDLQRERNNLQRALDHSEVGVVHLEHATLRSLRRTLLEREFHVLHFMGHGTFDAHTGEGGLYLEEPDSRHVLVTGRDFASRIKDFKSLRLVVFNSCDTARSISDEGANPFAGVAAAIVLAGVPAVIAMQFTISDLAAIAFSEEFYNRLASGDGVETAVAEGRQAIDAATPGTVEWATPILFLRTREEHSPPSSSKPAHHKRLHSLGNLLVGLALLLIASATLFHLWKSEDSSPTPTAIQAVTLEFRIGHLEIYEPLREFALANQFSIDLFNEPPTSALNTFRLSNNPDHRTLILEPGTYSLKPQYSDVRISPSTFVIAPLQGQQPIQFEVTILGNTIRIRTPSDLASPVKLERGSLSLPLANSSIISISGVPAGHYELSAEESPTYKGLRKSIRVPTGAGSHKFSFFPERKLAPLMAPIQTHSLAPQDTALLPQDAPRPGRSQANLVMLVRSVKMACVEEPNQVDLKPVLELLKNSISGTGRMPVIDKDKNELQTLLHQLERRGCKVLEE